MHVSPRLARRATRAVALGGVVAGAMMLTGCVDLTAFDTGQQGTIGPLEISITGCASKASSNCVLGFSGLESNNTGTGQVLLAVRIDSRFVPPSTFVTKNRAQTYTASPSYAAELTRLSPPAAGTRWVGYISDARTYSPGGTDTAVLPIAHPALPDGSPVADKWAGDVVLGARGVTADFPATRPVSCGDSLSSTDTDLTICEDASGGFSGSTVSDFGFVTPAPVAVQPGQTATIPVTGKAVGAPDLSINFALAATTTVPGATALTNVPTLAPPGRSTTTVVVSVAVPPGTPPGAYSVTLAGTLANGQRRSATGVLTVVGPAAAGGGGASAGGTGPKLASPAPRVTLALPRRMFAKDIATRGFALTVKTNRTVYATVRLTQRKRQGRRTKTIVVSKRVLVKSPSTVVRFKSTKLIRGSVSIRVSGTGFSLSRTTTFG